MPEDHNYQRIFDAMVADDRYRRNLDWGRPRSGHPEGTVRAHIAELERNLGRLRSSLNETEYWKLRLLIHSHDTFKPVAKDGVSISHPQSHASLAKVFLAEFISDADLLSIVQFHDEPYALFLQWKSKWQINQQRLQILIETIADWDLFLAFNIIDGCTQGKSREPIQWFFGQIDGRVTTRFSTADIIPAA